MVVSFRRLTVLLILSLVASGVVSGSAFAATPPQNTSPPTASTASGILPWPGQTLIATPGTWTGHPAPTFTYEWYRCDFSGTCVDTGQSGGTYLVTDPDYGNNLEVLVTGTNSAGHLSVMSASVPVISMPPELISPPTITGGTQVGDTLTATPGVWVTYPPYQASYSWSACDLTTGICGPGQPNNFGPTYTLTAADVGYQIQVTVYVDDGDHAAAQSAPTAIVTDAPPPAPSGPGSPAGSGSTTTTTAATTVTPAVVVIPRVTSSPTISGMATVGGKLTATPGSWSGSPTSYRYSWWDCGRSGGCRQISGATTSTYSVRDTDTGYRIVVQVTASNSAGDGNAAPSAETAVVPGPHIAAVNRALTKLLPRTGTAVLRHGGYSAAFQVPSAGKLTIVWRVTLGGHRLTVARFTARYLRASAARVTVRLAAAGRRLLTTRRSIVVKARLSFAPVDQPALVRHREFTLST